MSASAPLDVSTLDLLEKVLKIANLQADTALKQTQDQYTPWQVAIGGFTAGAAVVGAAVALGHWL